MHSPATSLYLIRHAHTQIQPDQDSTQWTLSAVGQQQAEELATLPLWQTVDRIIVSSEPKTMLTVALVQAQRNLPVTFLMHSMMDGMLRLLYRIL